MIKKFIKELWQFNKLRKKFGFQQSLNITYQLLQNQNIKVKYGGQSFYVNSEQNAKYHLLNSIDKIIKMVELLPVLKYQNILDIGANCGLFSLFIKSRFPEANVYAFEPSPTLQKILVDNLESKGVYIIPMAISNCIGNTDFFINESSQQTNSLIKKNIEIFGAKEKIKKQTIKTITLDVFVKQRNIENVDLIKLDVQGAENLVLQGGEKTLSQTTYLVVEVSFLDDSVFDFIEIVRQYFPYYQVINPVSYGADIFFSKIPLD